MYRRGGGSGGVGAGGGGWGSSVRSMSSASSFARLDTRPPVPGNICRRGEDVAGTDVVRFDVEMDGRLDVADADVRSGTKEEVEDASTRAPSVGNTGCGERPSRTTGDGGDDEKTQDGGRDDRPWTICSDARSPAVRAAELEALPESDEDDAPIEVDPAAGVDERFAVCRAAESLRR